MLPMDTRLACSPREHLRARRYNDGNVLSHDCAFSRQKSFYVQSDHYCRSSMRSRIFSPEKLSASLVCAPYRRRASGLGKVRRRLLYCFLGEARPKGLCYERGSKREESFRVGRSCCSVAISLRAAVRHSFDSVRFPRASVLAAVLASEQERECCSGRAFCMRE